jgi:hypothetical protein
VAAIDDGSGARFVNANEAVPLTPLVLAVTWYTPVVAFARTVTLAWPSALVVDVAPKGKVALAPFIGAVKVTSAPLTGFPMLSLTVA